MATAPTDPTANSFTSRLVPEAFSGKPEVLHNWSFVFEAW